MKPFDECVLKVIKAIFDSVDDGMALIDCNYDFILVNPIFCDMFAVEDVSSKKCYELVYRRKGSCVPCIPKLFDKAGKTLERVIIAPEESWATWLEIKEYPLKMDGNNIGYLMIVRDVSEKKKKEETLKEQALFDSLTGAYNKKVFYDYLGLMMENARRYGEPLSVVVFDIDNFKRINDTYGHIFGDRVLVEIAKIVRNNIRRSDIFGRIGGEEFAIILPKTNVEEAVILAERIREAVSDHLFVHAVKITVSIGIAGMKREDTPETLIARADSALYEAKRAGKNKVMVFN
ncbi:MAG: diguanylate cyclase [Thermosulfidibacteraceae bacterium]